MVRVSEYIVELLGVTTGKLEPIRQFESWVTERTARVRSSAAEGPPGLRLELAQLRAELSALRSVTSLPLRQSEVLWLEGLIELVGEVASDEARDGALQACA